MDLPDMQMVQELALRDGPIAEGSLSHAAGGACRYRSMYEEGECPWCAAVERRLQQQHGGSIRNGETG